MSTKRSKRKRKPENADALQNSNKRRRLNNNIQDANTNNNGVVAEIYCICREADNGEPMLQCADCCEWFHFSCLKMEEKCIIYETDFHCPFCNDTDNNKTENISNINNEDITDDDEKVKTKQKSVDLTINKLKDIQSTINSLQNNFESEQDILVRSLRERLKNKTKAIIELKAKINELTTDKNNLLRENEIRIKAKNATIIELEKKINELTTDKNNLLREHGIKMKAINDILQQNEIQINELQSKLMRKDELLRENEIKYAVKIEQCQTSKNKLLQSDQSANQINELQKQFDGSHDSIDSQETQNTEASNATHDIQDSEEQRNHLNDNVNNTKNNNNTNVNDESSATEWWQCEMCLIENEPEATFCAICTAPNTQVL